ncbi:MAG: hypothetical protein JSV03_04655, partial [Planctomycetota bacterium]
MKNPVERWLGGHHHRRRPISRRRTFVGVALLILVIIASVTYRQLTSEKRLRYFAERWLEDFSGGEAVIDRVRFNLFRGLDLVGVRLAIPESSSFDPQDNSFAGRTVFRSSTLFFRLDPFSIISGDLIVPEIVAENPELTLIKRKSDGVANWEVMFQQRKKRLASDWPMRLPEIRLRNVRLKQYRLGEHGRAGGSPQKIRAVARPLMDKPDVYEVRMAKIISSPDSPDMSAERGRIEVNLNSMAIVGNLPTMTIDELLFTASVEINHWLDILSLRGYIRPDTFSYDPESTTQAALSLRDAVFSIPLDAYEQQLPSQERYLRFKGMAGTINFVGRRAHVELKGRFRDSPITVEGDMYMVGRPVAGLNDIGFDLQLSVSNLPLPRDQKNAGAEEIRFVQKWSRLQKFVRDFDGIGPVDLSLLLHKSPGADYGVEFVEGTLTARGVSARYFRFPYRVHNLTGTVHFRKDKKIELKDLVGIHGKGRVVVNGVLGGYSSQFGRLEIVGENIELDDDLLRCLNSRDQKLCQLFNARAQMNLHVQLERADAPHGTEGNPWKPAINVTFIDGSINFAGFPYQLDKLNGKMRIAGGRFDIHKLTALRGDMRVNVTGKAGRTENGKVDLDLKLDAAKVRLDEVLAAALPEKTREMYESFAPNGLANLSGRLLWGANSDRIEYDFNALLFNAGLGLPGTGARLVDARADIRLTSDRLDIKSLEGKFGESIVVLKGHVGMEPEDPTMSLEFRSEQLHLNNSLRSALPTSLGKIWDLFKPAGSVALDLHFDRQRPTATQPGEQPESVINYRATLEPIDCTATFSGFPLPLSGITGRMVINPNKVIINKLTARHEKTTFELTGQIEITPFKKDVELSIKASDLKFTEDLRQAVPWRLRRMWNNVKPQGQADLSFNRLAFTVQPGQITHWSFEGDTKLEGVTLQIGPELSDIRGYLNLKGVFGSQFSCRGDLFLSQVRVDERLVTNVSAKLSRLPEDTLFSVEDIVGRFYEGTIIGNAEVNYIPGGPNYGLSLTARDVSLAKFLNAKRKPDEKPVELKGQVDGNLALAGKFGKARSRRGGGAIVIREAQMFKVPLILAILQVIHFAIDDNNAFHDGTLAFVVDGDELILNEIDLRGRSFSMVGAGRVATSSLGLDLTLLIGSPLRLPKVQVLTELLE